MIQGTGSINDPFLIYTKEDFHQITNLTVSNAIFKQMADITGVTEQQLLGSNNVYDGNGYNIQCNIITNSTASLFRCIVSTQIIIKNINVINSYIEGINQVAGIFVGTTTSSVTYVCKITDCSIINSTIKCVGNVSTSYVAGIAASSRSEIVLRCVVKDSVVESEFFRVTYGICSGGIVNFCSVVDSYIVSGSQSIPNNNTTTTFGITYLSSGYTVYGCFTSGKIEGLGACGISGNPGTLTKPGIENCYTTAELVSKSTNSTARTAGIFATSFSNSWIKNCYALNSKITYEGNINPTLIGRVQSNEAGVRENCYANQNMIYENILAGISSTTFPNENKTTTGKDGANISLSAGLSIAQQFQKTQQLSEPPNFDPTLNGKDGLTITMAQAMQKRTYLNSGWLIWDSEQVPDHNLNLWDGTFVEATIGSSCAFTPRPGTGNRVTTPITVNPNLTYVFGNGHPSFTRWVRWLDFQQNCLSSVLLGNVEGPVELTPHPDSMYVEYYYTNQSDESAYVKLVPNYWVIKEGQTFPYFEFYKIQDDGPTIVGYLKISTSVGNYKLYLAEVNDTLLEYNKLRISTPDGIKAAIIKSESDSKIKLSTDEGVKYWHGELEA